MPLSNAPTRSREKDFITPLVADVLFSELVDCSRKDIPEYGTPHPDSDKWPHHKLCFVREEPQAQRENVFRWFYVADRENQDLYNFESTRQSVGGREFQMVTRSYVTPRSKFLPHKPDFQEEMPNVPTDQFDGIDYVYFSKEQSRIGDKELDSLYVAETYVYVDKTMVGALTEITRSRPDMIPERFRWLIPKYRQTTIEAGQVTTNPTLESDDISVTENQINPDIKLVTRTKDKDVDGNTPTCIDGTRTDTWGINTTEECLVPAGTVSDSGYGVKQSTSERISETLNLKQTERYPEDEDGNGITYTLQELKFDDESNASWLVEKSLVDASRALDIAAAAATPDNSVELQAIDKWHSIMIVSQIRIDPEDQEWEEVGSISLPNKLEEVGVIWDADQQVSNDASGVDNIDVIEANDLQWRVSASASASAAISGGPYTKVVSGYRGPAVVRVTRTYHQGAPPASTTFDLPDFRPVHGSLIITGSSYSATRQAFKGGVGRTNLSSGGGSRDHIDNKLMIHNFGPVVWDTIEVQDYGDDKTVVVSSIATGGSTPSGGLYPAASVEVTLSGGATLKLPESSAPLQSGDEYTLDVRVRPWRNGWWVREVYTAVVP